MRPFLLSRWSTLSRPICPLHSRLENRYGLARLDHIRSSHQDAVRVRFAPSPTGFLHLGGLRTALINYIFARQNNGKFILRIEDTDKKRIVPGAAERLENTLEVFNIVPDESPKKGGPYGPYHQSERTELYREKAQELIEARHAYRCFCSELRLELLRKEALKNRNPVRYDGRCRHLTEEKIQEKLAANEPYTIRLKLTPGMMTLNDMVYGKITADVTQSEGDPIILKSDGFPTYHLANVVDDHHMQITHVLRGAEWQLSTLKHLMLFDYFKWEPPQYGHLPLIMNVDGTKLSKRHDHMRVEYILENGFDTQALVNYVLSIGGGYSTPGDDSGIAMYSLEELVEKLKIEKLHTAPPRFDMSRMKLFNRHCLLTMLTNDPEKLRDELRRLLKTRIGIESVADDYITKVFSLWEHRFNYLGELCGPEFEFIWRQPTLTFKQRPKISEKADLNEILTLTQKVIEDLDIPLKTLPVDKKDESQRIYAMINSEFKEIVKKYDMNYASYMRFLRLCLTNNYSGPPLAEIIELLGKSNTLDYLKYAQTFISIPQEDETNRDTIKG